MDKKASKAIRILTLYEKLINNNPLNKYEEANFWEVDERTIQRDIDDIRCFLSDKEVIYDRRNKGYKLKENKTERLTSAEILAICKILVSSRALKKNEMKNISDMLLSGISDRNDKSVVRGLVNNEIHHYMELKNQSNIIDDILRLGKAIHNFNFLTIKYGKQNKDNIVERRLKPVAIVFSEFYFYLLAYIDDKDLCEKFKDAKPTVYRIDRIKEYKVLDEKFRIPNKDRFELGEYKKKINYMYSGEKCMMRFVFSEQNSDCIYNKKNTGKDESMYWFEDDVTEHGIDIWIKYFDETK